VFKEVYKHQDIMTFKIVFRAFSLLLAAFVLISCEHDDEFNAIRNKVTVQFAAPEQSFNEDAGTRFIRINFNRPVLWPGELTIQLDVTDNTKFTTEPIAVNNIIRLLVYKNDSEAIIALTPVDNSTPGANTVVKFTVKGVSEVFISGETKNFTATILDDESGAQLGSKADFIGTHISLGENAAEGLTVPIQLSDPTTSAGLIHIEYLSAKATYGIDFTTEPAINNAGVIPLVVTAGSTVASFKVFPVKNNVITGELDIQFTIVAAEGAIQKGTNLTQDLRLNDLELAARPKGYEVSAASWGLKKTLEYNTQGKVSKVNWDSYTPYHRNGTDTYHYEGGLLVKINKSAVENIIYSYSGGKIIKSERVVNGVVKQYTLFDYDDFGNVSGSEEHVLQPGGDFELAFVTVYLYFQDGNLFKRLRYLPASHPNEYTLISTATYDGYLNVENPFPMVEILPTVSAQKNLPSSYRLEENGADLFYTLSYEFLEDGRPAKRTASGGGVNELALYQYYQ
jgi:hypothetical protein